MKKLKYSLAAVISLFALSMAAQETYQDTKMIGNELNGTARYVGMGGAMEALGADVSTIGSNPACLGIIRYLFPVALLPKAGRQLRPSMAG